MTEYDDRDDLSKPNLLPYGIVPQAPAIQVPNVDLFKKDKAKSATHHFETRINEIKKQYEKLMEDIHINDIIYSAKYNFVPIVGKPYYLYKTDDGYILSLIEPERWTRHIFIGAYSMRSDNIWDPV